MPPFVEEIVDRVAVPQILNDNGRRLSLERSHQRIVDQIIFGSCESLARAGFTLVVGTGRIDLLMELSAPLIHTARSMFNVELLTSCRVQALTGQFLLMGRLADALHASVAAVQFAK